MTTGSVQKEATARQPRPHQVNQCPNYTGQKLCNPISPSDVEQIFLALEAGDTPNALSIITAVLNTNSPTTSANYTEKDQLTNSKDESPLKRRDQLYELETATARAGITGQMILDLFSFAYKIGFSNTQAAILFYIFKTVHDTFIDFSLKQPPTQPKNCIDHFHILLDHYTVKSDQARFGNSGELQNRSVQSKGAKPKSSSIQATGSDVTSSKMAGFPYAGPLFTVREAIIIADYFIASYMHAVNLIAYTFTKHQAVFRVTKRLSVETPAILPPLAMGVPQEKWTEYLRLEAERKEREAEEQSILAAQQQRERELKSRETKSAAAREVKFAETEPEKPVPKYSPYPHPPPALPHLPPALGVTTTADYLAVATPVVTDHLSTLTNHLLDNLNHHHSQLLSRIQRLQEDCDERWEKKLAESKTLKSKAGGVDEKGSDSALRTGSARSVPRSGKSKANKK